MFAWRSPKAALAAAAFVPKTACRPTGSARSAASWLGCNAATTPDVVYQKIMRENAFKPTSGLGLARIRVEGGFAIEAAVEGTALTLTASATWAKPVA